MDPLTIGLLGGLLGGGTEQNVTTTQTFALAFNPVITTNIGGGVSGTRPNGSVTAIPTTTASTVDTPSSGGLPSLGGFGSTSGLSSASASGATSGTAGLSTPIIIFGLVAAGAAFLFLGKKGVA